MMPETSRCYGLAGAECRGLTGSGGLAGLFGFLYL